MLTVTKAKPAEPSVAPDPGNRSAGHTPLHHAVAPAPVAPAPAPQTLAERFEALEARVAKLEAAAKPA